MIKLTSTSRTLSSTRSRGLQRGVSLIELMVALVISLVLIGGAIQVFSFSRRNYEVNESVVRLQETARYALSVLEPDIRMANSWGLSKGADFVVPAPGLPGSNCGADFARVVSATLEASNNAYSFGCAAADGGAVASADTLVVRRASAVPSTVTSGKLLVCSTRSSIQLVQDSTPCIANPIGQVNDLIVNAYYISRNASYLTDLPTLHRFGLVNPSTLADVAIVPGVEDMQIQFGIDPTGNRGIAQGYVNPDAVPAGAQIVSVRLWLLVRAETEETGYTNQETYEYGDRDDANGTTDDLNATGAAKAAYKPNDGFRRLLVSRTILIRNAMGI
ncbi:PilW family protein [Peristeroidobacter agariperforans]|uniref:PilW family protein n=1 Tax=Peristeroidobacter agariperforans TaxID=268404 RepID=UPI00101E03FE|nr:PilW family protein [Peristeroidobacter agariperforans]